MFLQVGFSLGRIPLEFERHSRTLHEPKIFGPWHNDLTRSRAEPRVLCAAREPERLCRERRRLQRLAGPCYRSFLNFFDRETSVTNDTAHCVLIDGIVTRNRKDATPVSHHDVSYLE